MPHPESDRLRHALERCASRAVRWSGVVYRSASPRYANKDDLLTGVGSKTAGARWNPPKSFPTVYSSLDPQALGRIGHELGREAFLVPSAARRGGSNLVIFPANLAQRSLLEIINAGNCRVTTRCYANLHADPLTLPLVPGIIGAEVRMATNKKKAVARKISGRGDAFRPAQLLSVSTVRGRLGLSRKLFSRLAGFSERAIADWEGGKPVSEPGRRRIKELDRFRDRLSEVVAADAIPSWLDTPNEAFDGLKPLEVIERGEIDRLWNMIFYLESGVAS